MRTWQADKRRADLCIPQMQGIVGQHLAVRVAPTEDDAKRNTDLIVLAVDDRQLRVACRVRDYRRYYSKYGHQFTIRASRDSGVKVELAKVLDGWGDYLLYGFADWSSAFAVPRFVSWTLADLNVFRSHYVLGMGEPVRNPDGTAGRAFNWTDFPGGLVVATSRKEQAALT
jgi:hypothetical protein